MSAPAYFELNSNLKASVLNAFTGNGNTNAVPVSCPTGNCTFPKPYASLAICHRCEDIISLVRPDCGPKFANDSWAGWTLPGGLHIGGPRRTGAMLNVSTNLLGFMHTALIFSHPDWGQGIQSSWVPGNDALVCSSDEPGADRFVQYAEGNPRIGYYSLVAANCSLYPCVKHYTAEVRNAVLVETPISSTDPFGEQDGYEEYSKLREFPKLYDDVTIPITPCTIGEAIYTLKNMSLAPETPNGAVSYNRSGQTFRLPAECVARMSGSFLDGMESFMRSLMEGICQQYESLVGHPESINCHDRDVAVSSSTATDSWWLATLFNNWNSTFAHVDRVFERVAAGITAHIRQNPGSDYWMFPDRNESIPIDELPAVPHFADGVMKSTTVCVLVDWRWLSFHAVLIGLAAVPFAVMAAQQQQQQQQQQQAPSRREGRIPQWKSSLLPLLFHGFPHQNPPPPACSPPASTGVGSHEPLLPRELEDIARGTIVEFQAVEGGYKLVKMESSGGKRLE